jgi:hypothetical protein
MWQIGGCLDDIGWSGFEKKLMGNFDSIARDHNPLLYFLNVGHNTYKYTHNNIYIYI